MPLPYRLLYSIGLRPWEQKRIPTDLAALVEGDSRLAPGRALDLGCGTGTQSIYLAEHGWEVVGVDYIAKAVATAEQKSQGLERRPTWICGDATRLEDLALGGGFGLVLDIGTLFAFDDVARKRAVGGLNQICDPGAHLLRFGLTDGENVEETFGPAWELLWYRNEREPRIKRKNASPAWSLLRKC